jgi:large subunit ribosomal protein L24
MTMKKIKRGDKVVVTSGRDKGKQGEIVKILINEDKAIVSNINVYKKHLKPNKQVPNGGIVSKEMPIAISNLSHIDPKLGVPTKVGFKFENNQKVRYAKKSGELL